MDESKFPETKVIDASPAAPRRRLRRSHVAAALLTVLAVLWIASGMIGDDASPSGAPSGSATKTAEPVAVRIVESTAVSRPKRISIFGRTDAIVDAEIKAETSGRVVARPAEKGTVVDKGKVLLELAMNDRQAKLREAEAQFASARISYDAAKNLSKKQFESQTKLAETAAALASAEAALEAIRLDIARTKIAAPIHGYVERLDLNPGDYVTAGDVVALVLNLDPIRVVAAVSESDVGDVALDDEAAVRLPGGAVLNGKVRYISRLASEATRTYRVDDWLDNPDNRIPAGQTAEVLLSVGRHAAHRLRKSALTLNDKGAVGVKTVDAEDRVHFRPVRIVDDTAEGVWVDGLPEKVRLIVLGQEFVIDDERVRPVIDGAASGGGS